jgi:hypothetical protein
MVDARLGNTLRIHKVDLQAGGESSNSSATSDACAA